MNTLLQDIRYAARSLVNARGFTAIAVVCLALGIGINSAVFSIINALLVRPFPFDRPEQIVSLYSQNRRSGMNEWSLSRDDLADLRTGTSVFADLGAFSGRNYALAGTADAERVQGLLASPNLFPMLGIAPMLGRTFREDEAVEGRNRVVIIAHSLWRRRFAEDRGIIGRSVLVNGLPHTIVGVMPRGFQFPETSELWVPLRTDVTEPRDVRYLGVIGRLKDGVDVDAATRATIALSGRLATEHPGTNRDWRVVVKSYREDMIDGELRLVLFLMMGAVGFVLLIACANVANLLLARASARSRELAIRAALGASRWRVFRQLLVESVLLSVLGGVIGILVAVWWKDYTIGRIPEQLPYWIDFSIDGVVLFYTLVLSIVTGVVFGTLPALRASRVEVSGALKEGARGGIGGFGRNRLRNVLVGAEVALSVTLLVGAALMIKSFLATARADYGFDTNPVLTMRIYMAGERYDLATAKAGYLMQAVERIRELPSVQAVAATGAIPGDDGGSWTTVHPEGMAIGADSGILGNVVPTTPDFFNALGLRLLAGRSFTGAEAIDSTARVAIINDRLARKLWPGGDALGRRIRVVDVDSTAWLTIVGIAPTIQYEELGEEEPQTLLQVHVPYAATSWRTAGIVVRTAGQPAQLASAVRRAVRNVDGTLPVYDLRTMDEVKRLANWQYGVYSQVFGSFAVLALLLAAFGVYGVMAYSVSQRSQEIGIRMALGAQRHEVLTMVVKHGAMLAAAGSAVGLVGAFGVSRVMREALYGVEVNAPGPFIIVTITLIAVATIASWVPARRASRMDPAVALRTGQ